MNAQLTSQLAIALLGSRRQPQAPVSPKQLSDEEIFRTLLQKLEENDENVDQMAAEEESKEDDAEDPDDDSDEPRRGMLCESTGICLFKAIVSGTSAADSSGHVSHAEEKNDDKEQSGLSMLFETRHVANLQSVKKGLLHTYSVIFKNVAQAPTTVLEDGKETTPGDAGHSDSSDISSARTVQLLDALNQHYLWIVQRGESGKIVGLISPPEEAGWVLDFKRSIVRPLNTVYRKGSASADDLAAKTFALAEVDLDGHHKSAYHVKEVAGHPELVDVYRAAHYSLLSEEGSDSGEAAGGEGESSETQAAEEVEEAAAKPNGDLPKEDRVRAKVQSKTRINRNSGVLVDCTEEDEVICCFCRVDAIFRLTTGVRIRSLRRRGRRKKRRMRKWAIPRSASF